MEPGSLADWFGALTTLAATVAAVVGGIVAWRAYQANARKDRQAEAAEVHAWLADDISVTKEGRPKKGAQRLVLVNGGPGLIYDVRVELVRRGRPEVAPRGAEPWELIPSGTFVVTPDPVYGWSLPEPVTDLEHYRPYSRSEEHMVLSLTFTDGHGRRWRRERSGQLVELD